MARRISQSKKLVSVLEPTIRKIDKWLLVDENQFEAAQVRTANKWLKALVETFRSEEQKAMIKYETSIK